MGMNFQYLQSLKRQVFILTRLSLRARYRKTIAGFLWVIMNPLIILFVQALVFRHFLNIQLPNYFLFLLTGLLPWIYISQCLEMGTPFFQTSGQLLKSFRVNPMVYLSSLILDNLINFLSAFIIVLIPVWVNSNGNPLMLLLLPLPVILMTVALMGQACFLSTLQVFWGDTRFIVRFVLGVVYFLTPIFYPRTYIPEKLNWIVDVNPFYYMIKPFRYLLVEYDLNLFFHSLMQEAVMAMICVVAAILLWKKKRNLFYFYV